MLETEIRDLFQSQVASELPAARISIAVAHRTARRRLRLRRAGVAASPLVAAVAVLAVVLSGTTAFTAAGSTPADRSRQPAPRSFSPTRPYVRLTWLPGRSVVSKYALSAAGDFVMISGSASYTLMIAPAGQCDLTGQGLTCWGGTGRQRLGPVIGSVGGRSARFTRLRANVGLVTWQYAPGDWALLRSPSARGAVRTALRIARGARLGPAVAAAARFPYQLTDVPADWTIHSVTVQPGRNDLVQAVSVAGPAGSRQNVPGIIDEPAGTMGACRRLINPPPGESPGSYLTVRGYRVLVSAGFRGPSGVRPAVLCAPDAGGVLLELQGGSRSLTVSWFEHNLRLLGPDPAHWTTRPLG